MAFQKGQSGNPGGRPLTPWTMKGEYIKALMRKTLDGTPMKQGIAEALVDKALQGDVLAIREVNNRIDGMPKQEIEHSGTIGGNVSLPAEHPLDAPPQTDPGTESQ